MADAGKDFHDWVINFIARQEKLAKIIKDLGPGIKYLIEVIKAFDDNLTATIADGEATVADGEDPKKIKMFLDTLKDYDKYAKNQGWENEITFDSNGDEVPVEIRTKVPVEETEKYQQAATEFAKNLDDALRGVEKTTIIDKNIAPFVTDVAKEEGIDLPIQSIGMPIEITTNGAERATMERAIDRAAVRAMSDDLSRITITQDDLNKLQTDGNLALLGMTKEKSAIPERNLGGSASRQVKVGASAPSQNSPEIGDGQIPERTPSNKYNAMITKHTSSTVPTCDVYVKEADVTNLLADMERLGILNLSKSVKKLPKDLAQTKLKVEDLTKVCKEIAAEEQKDLTLENPVRGGKSL